MAITRSQLVQHDLSSGDQKEFAEASTDTAYMEKGHCKSIFSKAGRFAYMSTNDLQNYKNPLPTRMACGQPVRIE